MPRKARKRQEKAVETRKKSHLDAELEFYAARFFMIDNLAFLKFIGYPIKKESIECHNRAVQDYGMPKIDPEKLEYVNKEDPRWESL